MKRKTINYLVLFLLGVGSLFASCTKTNIVVEEELDPTMLSFRPSVMPIDGSTQTKGTPYDAISKVPNMGVFAYYTGTDNWTGSNISATEMNNQKVEQKQTGKWTYSPIRYWAKGKKTTVFGYAPYVDVNNRSGNGLKIERAYTSTPYIKYTVPTDCKKQPDLLVGTTAYNQNSGSIDFRFVHALSSVAFKISGGNESITKISIKGISTSGKLSLGYTNGEAIAWSELGAVNNSEYSAGIPEGLVATEDEVNATAADGYLMMIPQTLGENAKLVVTIDGEDREVALSGSWEANKKYTYVLSVKSVDSELIIDNLVWATGNLIADGENGCKIGKPTDNGLYFQFGSLLGWTGGANGNGIGQGKPSLAVQVKPAEYNGNPNWSSAPRYKDVADGASVPLTFDPSTGIGDPCRYYLGDPWRLPTAGEYTKLFDDVGMGTEWKYVSNWNWQESPTGAIHKKGLFLPILGSRESADGKLSFRDTNSSYWSSTMDFASNGGFLHFSSTNVTPEVYNITSFGLPVRCVQDVPIIIKDLIVAKGHLVADGKNGCKIGEPTDGGLYFQFGSLIGWTGGANGDGTGFGSPSLAVKVKPAEYRGNPDWTSAPYYKNGKGGSVVPLTFDPSTGIGDPCRHYLGKSWRLPTREENMKIFDNVSSGNWNNIPNWSWQSSPLGPIHKNGLFFPFSGSRKFNDGSLSSVNKFGTSWSSTVSHALDYTFAIGFNTNAVNTESPNKPTYGFPIRCVRDMPIVIDNFVIAKGNLVADGENACKIGDPTDCGLYFQFGSLLGWAGGTNGDGKGFGEPALVVKVKPAEYHGETSWSSAYYKGGSLIPLVFDPSTGIGDPCRHYLGDPWRLPMPDEVYKIFGVSGYSYWREAPNWSWHIAPNGAVRQTDFYHDVDYLFIPAAGYRGVRDFYNLGTHGYYWTRSVRVDIHGENIYFSSTHLHPVWFEDRDLGMPIRCVYTK